jgi:arabinofuranan 3-O-arabinosyltransferase
VTAVAADPRADEEPRSTPAAGPRRRWPRAGPHLVLAVVAYLPLLVTQPGRVVADTKQYLFLDPGGVLAGSRSLWDPDWALGTVTHQSVGYLWPMGPWYRFFELVGAPVWVAQRLWLGTILFAAGAGVLFLGRVFGWGRRSAAVASLVYVLSPYPLAYATRISALILPWAGLPWLVGLGVRALRCGGWRDPALLALVATTVGAVNASSLLYAGLAVILWFPFAVFVHQEATLGAAVAAMGRIGVLLTALSLWWLVALAVQGRYGADVLRFSETLEVVASGSPSTEAWRGLGYWIFYGGDRTGLWVSAGEPYTQSPALLVATFGLAVVSLGLLFAFRWRYRAYVLTLAVAGIALTIGLYPYDAPGTLAGLVRDGASESSLALALRSSPRALPLYLLAVACAVAVSLDALARLRPRLAPLAAAALVALAAAGIAPLWTGRYIGDELARDEEVPAAWRATGQWLDGTDANHRALIVPGSDFSAHRWGNTIDHVLPGLTDRPVAVRELVAFGLPASADLLIALDRRLQERVASPEQLAPIARLLGAGSVIVQSDLEYERYRTPRPASLWALATAAPGFDEPVALGPPYANRPAPAWPMVDEVSLALDPDLADPPQVAALPVVDPLGVVRAHPARSPLVVAGDGESLLSLAGAGLLDGHGAVLYEAALDDEQLAAAVESGAGVVITDGNRLRARRWKTIRDNLGLTERLGGDGLRRDPTDARLDVFPDAPADSFTVAEHAGVAVSASSYGNPISYHPEDRAVHAADCDPSTAWRVAAFSDARGEHLELTWDEPVTASAVRLLQPLSRHRDRWITDLLVSVDGGSPFPVTLDERSLAQPGQEVDLGVGQVRTLRLEIVETSAGRRPGYSGLSPVGLAEVSLEGAPPATETIVLPGSVARRLADLPAANPLTVVLERERVDASSAVREDPETALARVVELPGTRDFTVSGTARLSGQAPTGPVDDTLGMPAAPRATATDRMPGPAVGRASAVFDGDRATVWRTPFGAPLGQQLTVDLGEVRSLDGFTVSVLADGRHSVPTALGLQVENGDSRFVTLPAVANGPAGTVVTLPVAFAPLEGRYLTVSLEGVDEHLTTDWYSGGPIALPVGIAEVTVADLPPAATPERLPDSCRDDLLAIDGRPVNLRLVGSTAEAADGAGVALEACDGPLALGPGPVRIETAAGRQVGVDVDQLVLHAPGIPHEGVGGGAPAVRVADTGRDRTTVEVAGATEPFWLVLGQSFSPGWQARTTGGRDLGPPTLIDGFANGWLIDPAPLGPEVTIDVRWTPNSTVRAAMAASAVAAVTALALVLWPRRRRPAERAVPCDRPAGRAVPGDRPAARGAPALTFGVERRPVLSPGAAVGAGVATAVLVTAATRPVLGVGAGLAVLTAAFWRHTLAAVAAGGVGALALAGAYVTIQQVRYSPPHDGAWPSLWDRAHLAGWAALAALAVAAVVEIAVSARRAGRDRPVSADPR